ncbi:hypothetical protein FACS189452_05910 [Bacteroidia bacterium]|nr:hypothetical protein FACS189452_05910 [Bacteroidia bacterium]
MLIRHKEIIEEFAKKHADIVVALQNTMIKQFENITKVETRELYDVMTEYEEYLIREATANGALAEQDANNEYTREIGRVGSMCADYETNFMTFKYIKFKSPLLTNIEKEFTKRAPKIGYILPTKQKRRLVTA